MHGSNQLQENSLQLQEYGEYLLSRSLVHDNQARYYVHWMRRFFRLSQECPAERWDLLLQRFVDHLEADDSVQDWQVAQAE